MTREIKFRGYSYAKGGWLYGNLIEKDNPQIEIPTPWVRLIHNRALDAEMVVFESVGQYVGLSDKNGVDVYEGDVVRLIEPQRNYTVEYVDFCFKLIHADPKLDRMVWGGLHRIDELAFTPEVIGNIYENPELLK